MKVSSAGLAFIAGHEGIVPYPYRDSVGVWTFGVGHTRYAGDPDPAKLPRGQEQSIDYVMDLFSNDIAKYERDVSAAVRVQVSQHEFDALVSFHYNTGGITRANLVRSLNVGNRGRAADQFLNWSKPREIIPRRTAEMRLFEAGDYGDGFANVYRATSSGKVVWGSAKRVRVLDFLKEDEPLVLTEEDEEHPTLRLWTNNPEKIRELQTLLNKHRAQLKTDGLFGPGTQRAVENFQRKLVEYGVVGKFTWAALLA